MILGCDDPCPGDLRQDPVREQAIRDRVDVGAPICFGTPSAWDGRVIRIDPATGDDEAAARAAHLDRHRTDATAMTGDDPCDRRVAAAMAAEARAWALEMRLRTELGVTDPVGLT